MSKKRIKNIDYIIEAAAKMFGGVRTFQEYKSFTKWLKKERHFVKIGSTDKLKEVLAKIAGDRFFVKEVEGGFIIRFDAYIPSLEESGMTVEENFEQNFRVLEADQDPERYLRWVSRQVDGMSIDPDNGFVCLPPEKFKETMTKYLPWFDISSFDEESC